MTYIPNHSYFKPEEFVSRAVCKALGHNPTLIFWQFDDRLLYTADRLRIRYGVMRLNNWLWGGPFQQRGFRGADANEKAAFSDHNNGRVLDPQFAEVSADEVRAEILADPWHEDFKFITSLEMTLNGKSISWVHFSTRNWDKARFGIQQLHI